jgi:hypothetical protein
MSIINNYPINGYKTIGSINYRPAVLSNNGAQVFRNFIYDGYSAQIFGEQFWSVVTPPASGILLTYNGSSWVNALIRYYNGTIWVDTDLRYWTGTEWYPTTQNIVTIFSDNFDGTTLGANWQLFFEATATVANGLMTRTDSGNYRGMFTEVPESNTDYTVTWVISHNVTYSLYKGFAVRTSTDWWTRTGVQIFWETPGTIQISDGAYYYDTNNITPTINNGFPASWTVDQDHTVRIRCEGSTITVHLGTVGNEEEHLAWQFTSTVNQTLVGQLTGITGEGSNASYSSCIITTGDGVASGGVTDNQIPVVTFVVPATSSTLQIPITTLTSTFGPSGANGYIVTINDSTAPLANDARWGAAPTYLIVPSDGNYTLRAYSRSVSGLVSAAVSQTCVVAVSTTEPVVIFEDLFNGTTLNAAWASGQGATATVAGGLMTRTDTGAYRILSAAVPNFTTDYTVTWVVSHNVVTNSYKGFCVRMQDTIDYLQTGVQIFWQAPNTTIQVMDGQLDSEASNITPTVNNGYQASWAIDQDHTVRIRCEGSAFTVWFGTVGNEEAHLALQFTSTVNQTLAGQRIGISGEGNNCTYASCTVASLAAAPAAITITSTSATLSLQMRLSAAADVDFGGTVSSLAAGNHVINTTGNRNVSLLVTPWSSCDVLNLGYSGGDGGFDTEEYQADGLIPHTTQSISAITGIVNATHLRHLLLSETAITALDCSGCSSLERIEAYMAQSLTSINLTGCVSLRRPCFEDCDIPGVLDLSASTNLRDIRGTQNRLTSIVFPTNVSLLWHWCTMNNQFGGATFDYSRYTSLHQLWVAGSNLGGALVVRSGVLGSAWLENNAYTSLDLDNQVLTSNDGRITAQDNSIATCTVANCPGITVLNLTNNLLPQAQVDQVLAQLVAAGSTGARTLSLGGTGNAAPSAAGLTNVATLQSRGWTVTHN